MIELGGLGFRVVEYYAAIENYDRHSRGYKIFKTPDLTLPDLRVDVPEGPILDPCIRALLARRIRFTRQDADLYVVVLRNCSV